MPTPARGRLREGEDKRGAVRSLRAASWLGALAVVPALPASLHAFDYESLVAMIEGEGLATMEQVIERLPADYLENYTLVFDSRSLHGSSHDHPRAILFGTDARLVLTFNGHPDQRRYHDMEVIQFREPANVFELRSISFENGVRFSEKNPELCLSCHGREPRPIWSSYEYSDAQDVQHWPGFYGSTHDAPRLNEAEKSAFRRFRESARVHPRYRWLRLEHPQSKWYPFGVGPYKHRFRPNNRIGNLLARLNAERIADGVLRGSFFQDHSDVSLLWLLKCPQLEDERHLAFIGRLYRQDYPGLPAVGLAESPSVERIAFVLEKLLTGPDVYTWNLSLEPDPDDPRFFTGIVSIDELVAAAVLARLPKDHWIREYYEPWTQRELYDTFKAGYFDANVAPGGVGAVYDAIGPFFDRDRARQSCPELDARAQREAGEQSLPPAR